MPWIPAFAGMTIVVWRIFLFMPGFEVFSNLRSQIVTSSLGDTVGFNLRV